MRFVGDRGPQSPKPRRPRTLSAPKSLQSQSPDADAASSSQVGDSAASNLHHIIIPGGFEQTPRSISISWPCLWPEIYDLYLCYYAHVATLVTRLYSTTASFPNPQRWRVIAHHVSLWIVTHGIHPDQLQVLVRRRTVKACHQLVLVRR